MVASDPPAPLGGAQSVMPSLLRLSSGNSGMLGGQGGVMPSQGAFPSLVPPRGQFNNGSLLGNGSNVASLLNHPFSNGNASPMIYGGLNGPGGGIVGGPETDEIANGIGFNPEKTNNIASSGTSGQVQGQPFPSPSDNLMLPDNLHSQQLKSQNVQHPQQPYQSIRGGLGGGDPVKLESQVTGNQLGNPQQQLPPPRGLSQVKLESQRLQNMGNVASVKIEPQQSDHALLSPQQQKHQLMQQMSMPRHSSNAAAATTQLNVLQQHKRPQLHQHHLIRSLPPQSQPQFSPLTGPLRSPVKSVYEPGMCARRLTHYMYQQQHRPENNNIEFWRKFVAEYFAPNAKKKWCVSMYGSGRQTIGVFPQDVWHCEICKRKPGRGFEATVEVLPRLFKIKYESGTLEELLYVDMPREYQNSSGQIVLDYAKAIQESVFEQLRVVRDGQLRIVFSSELKICSWEFCAQRHEELIPRRLMIPQVSQLGAVAQKYQSSTQNTSSDVSVSELQTNCNMFAASARQLAKTLEVPLVNDLGYTKRYVRCLQISEVVNSMKDLIDCSRLTGEGPMESLAKFPRRTTTPSALLGQNQQSEQPLQQAVALNSNSHNEQGSSQGGTMQFPSTNGMATVNNSLYPSSSTSNSTIAGLLRQNKMNSREKIPINNANGLYSATSSVQIMSPAAQQSPSFQPPMPSSSIDPPQSSNGTLAVPMMNSGNSPVVSNMQQPGFSGDANTKDTQSSTQKFIQEMMMNKSNQLNDGGLVATDSLRSDVKNVNGILPIGNSDLEMPTYLVGSGPMNNNSGLGPFCGMGQGSMVHGVRATMANNSINGRVGLVSMARNQSMNHQLPQDDLGNQILGNLGAVNGFNGLPFD